MYLFKIKLIATYNKMKVEVLIFLLLSFFGLCTSQNKRTFSIVSTPFLQSIYKVGLIIRLGIFEVFNLCNLDVDNGQHLDIVAKSIRDWAYLKLEVDGSTISETAKLTSFMDVVDSFKTKK